MKQGMSESAAKFYFCRLLAMYNLPLFADYQISMDRVRPCTLTVFYSILPFGEN